MNTALRKSEGQVHTVYFGSKRIDFLLSRRPRKTLSISVHPDLEVTVVAPDGEDVAVIRERVQRRGKWILKQKSYFSEFQPRPKAKRYVSGESFRYLGRQYRLKVRTGELQKVILKDGFLNVYTPDKSKVKRILDSWFRAQARKQFALSLDRCLPRFSRYRIKTPELVIRIMAKRWGSCSRSGTITLNPELVRASSRCIDYVIVHELCHLIVRDHSTAFFKLLSSILPDWQRRKLALEQSFQ